MENTVKRTAKDYASNQEVRWCPGCGDYAILKGVQKTLADLQSPPEDHVFISGIGCAARFPYYMETYGFHTIHGRAAAIASGVRLANPDINLWVVSGDGDSLSIGGNHVLHLVRRNLNMQYLLFNNEVYGLTKGQYSPTSEQGFRSPTSPRGVVEEPVEAGSFVLGAGGRFFARAVDVQIPKLSNILKESLAFQGTGFVEILQNCIVYHDGAFDEILDKEHPEHQLWVEHGEPMTFGKNKEKGLVFNAQTMSLETVTLRDGVTEDHLLRHDKHNKLLAQLLVSLKPPYFPRVFGVIYQDDTAKTFESSKGRAKVLSRSVLEDALQGNHTFLYKE